MSTAGASTKPRHDCDECSRKEVEIARVYRGHRYCRTCYAREFKHRACPGCGETARLPREYPKAVCRTCERSRPCVRCGREMDRISLVTPYGPACGACAPYFREEEPCEACGTPSRRLTRVARLGHDLRVCPRCARADHGTCASCKRHRLLTEQEDGEWFCKRCREDGDVPCPSCGEPMPAGRGKQCERCYLDGLADARTRLNAAAFSTPTMASHFVEFGMWLKATRGPAKAAQKVHRFVPFFSELERTWGRIPEYGELVAHFGAKKLRAVLLAMRWMEESGLVRPDPEAREAESDRRRIEATLARFPEGSRAREILDGYHDLLDMRVEAGRTSTRSVRLAIAPAARLLAAALKAGRTVPDQKVLDRYLKQTPGQRAALSGFVRHLHDAMDVQLSLPPLDRRAAARRRRRKLREEMLELMRGGETGPSADRQWMATALAYLHDMPKKVADEVAAKCAGPHRQGGNVQIGGKQYWIPPRNSCTSSMGFQRP